MSFSLWVLTLPIVLIVAFIVSFAFVIGLYVMLNMWKAGKYTEVDRSNWLGRLLGFVQLSKHVPKMMRATFVWTGGGEALMQIEPGDYEIKRANSGRAPFTVRITRPFLNMNRQDLMEQLDFRPDDGRVDGKPQKVEDDIQ